MHEANPLRDLLAVPERAVLLGQQDDLAALVGAALATGVVQEHQGEQALYLWLLRHHLVQHPSEADRLSAELLADQLVRAGRRVALVEDQVQGREHRRPAFTKRLPGRDLVRDRRVADLPLGADEALGHRALRGEEGPRDLGRRQPAERPQSERHPRFDRQRRVAGGEDQPQPVVGELLGLDHGRLRLVGGWTFQRLDQPALLGESLLTAQAVDRAVSPDPDDPRGRVIGYAVRGPALQSPHERVLNRLLGKVEVAEDADQSRDRPPRLTPEQAADVLRARV